MGLEVGVRVSRADFRVVDAANMRYDQTQVGRFTIMPLLGHVKNGVVVPDEGFDLPDDTKLPPQFKCLLVACADKISLKSRDTFSK